MNIKLAYSPDADDAFMFRAAIDKLIDTEGLTFEPVTADTGSLNDLAIAGAVDVTAISVAAYPLIASGYLLLRHGGSVGRGYGPVIVSKRPHAIEHLPSLTIATPGETTTAHLIARLIAPDATMTTVPITPYEAIFEAIESGAVDAGIIIHEGRLTYESHGLSKIVDLGEWWMGETGLPLPLGANVVRRGLGGEVIGRVDRVLKESIGWALANRDEMIDYLIDHVHRPDEVAEKHLLDRYLAMYANNETYGYADDTIRAIHEVIERGVAAGVIHADVAVEFA